MNKLATFLIDEQQAHRKGGLYHKTQVQLAYNSNRIEGSKLTEEQTRYIFETRTIGFKKPFPWMTSSRQPTTSLPSTTSCAPSMSP